MNDQVEPSSIDYKRLLKKRTTLQKTVAASKVFVQNFDKKTKTCRQPKLRLEEVNKTIERFEEVQSNIEELDDRPDVQDSIRLAFQEEAYEVCASLLDIIDEFEKINLDSGQTNTSHSSSSRDRGFVQLPAVPAPKFDGSLQDWPSFIDSFNAMFHENLNLATVQKFHYLKTCLIGSAADIVKTIPTTAENYMHAYNTLKTRYENKTLIIQSHIRSLFDSPKVERASAYELRRLHHHIVSHVSSLKALGQPTEFWDAWLVTLVCSRLDSVTVSQWQLQQSATVLPLYAEIESFLSNRVAAFEAGELASAQITAIDKPSRYKQSSQMSYKGQERRVLLANLHEYKSRCTVCAQEHQLYHCNEFLNKSLPDKKDIVFKNRLCYNCLRSRHQVKQCRSSGCTKCGKKHHSVLHQEAPNASEEQSEPHSSGPAIAMYVEQAPPSISYSNYHAMLATCMINIDNAAGVPLVCRAVLDTGSQLNFLTNACAHRLMLKSTNGSTLVTGIGSNSVYSKGLAPATISSQCGQYVSTIQFHTLPVISNQLPTIHVDINNIVIPNAVKYQLADPQFFKPAPIDCLLGAEVAFELFNGDRLAINKHLSAYHTKLGWVITGRLFNPTCTNLTSALSTVIKPSSRNSAIALFATKTNLRIKEEQEAESYFCSTVERTDDGRFIVRLPLKTNLDTLGQSKHMAQLRFINLERRLVKDSSLVVEYNSFLKEYIELGHMEEVNADVDIPDKPIYYLPHHAVVKTNSLTTKVRVVFDGSASSSTGVSLNDVLMNGQTVQPDLCSILLRFRIHKIVMTADIEKMYRQVRVHNDDCDLQRIVHRFSPNEALKEYRLLTVTYGTKPASYLATRCLSQVGYDCKSPAVQRVITQDFYVDDLLTGTETIEECFKLFQSVSQELHQACMPLRKWCSNSKVLMEKMQVPHHDEMYVLQLEENDTTSALGLTWQPTTDSFRFSVKHWDPPARMTKRTLLSDIHSVYDPLGLLTPALIKGKIFLQQLWALKINWDSTLPVDLQEKWEQFYKGLQRLQQLSVPRRVISHAPVIIELHGFSDASQHAYGACLYARSLTPEGTFHSSLITSKSRVAPMHPTSIPRLELCGAVLLAELYHVVINEFKHLNIYFEKENVMLWTDSAIVLAWINSAMPLKQYISNRVAQILDVTNASQWNHISTDQNPADIITRGIDPVQLINHTSWWSGPSWLRQKREQWSVPPAPLVDEVPEMRPIKLVLSTVKHYTMLLDDYSDWTRLIRITSWVTRFIFNSRISSSYCYNRIIGALTTSELNNAKTLWVLHAQKLSFKEEILSLKQKRKLPSKSSLKLLNPFIDCDGLIRVGGRLSQASISDSAKFPIVLPSNSKVVRLLFEHMHKTLLHVGPQGLLAYAHNCYWPIRGRSLARSVVHRCVTCWKTAPTLLTPLMAPLPRQRVTITRPFLTTGVDFCGPFMIKSGIRRVISTKVYVSVFICFVTRAVHLELVSSLTTEAFLAALNRFVSRRGHCSHFYSDNGTNFVGASKVLQRYFKKVQGERALEDKLADDGITWHFIPPSAPHFGGLWEAGVRSAKKHLLKITMGTLFTFEELSTLLCRVEAVLNSRPLTPLSSSPSDYEPLTPSHFLVGSVMTVPVEPDMSNVPVNRLQRFDLIRAQTQLFWTRWSKEYLPQLQKRNRWVIPSRQININDLVILKEDGLPPFKWRMCRVIAIHPGLDGVIRVVSLQTSSGATFKRPVTKLSLLPTTTDEDED